MRGSDFSPYGKCSLMKLFIWVAYNLGQESDSSTVGILQSNKFGFLAATREHSLLGGGGGYHSKAGLQFDWFGFSSFSTCSTSLVKSNLVKLESKHTVIPTPMVSILWLWQVKNCCNCVLSNTCSGWLRGGC